MSDTGGTKDSGIQARPACYRGWWRTRKHDYEWVTKQRRDKDIYGQDVFYEVLQCKHCGHILPCQGGLGELDTG